MNMRGGLSGAHGRYELKLTSMIDVVFLLLIFFIVTLKFRVPERRMQADLPQDSIEVTAEDVEQVQIMIRRDGDDVIIEVNNDVYRDFEALERRLRGLRELFARTRTPHIFILDGSQDLPFQHFVSGVNACLAAGIPDISFAPPPLGTF